MSSVSCLSVSNDWKQSRSCAHLFLHLVLYQTLLLIHAELALVTYRYLFPGPVGQMERNSATSLEVFVAYWILSVV